MPKNLKKPVTYRARGPIFLIVANKVTIPSSMCLNAVLIESLYIGQIDLMK